MNYCHIPLNSSVLKRLHQQVSDKNNNPHTVVGSEFQVTGAGVISAVL